MGFGRVIRLKIGQSAANNLEREKRSTTIEKVSK